MIDKEKHRQSNKKWYDKCKEERRLYNRQAQQKLREKLGSDEVSRRNRYYNKRRKILVLTHYGNGKLACVKCGFSDIRALSIDHINGGGSEERIAKIKRGTKFYSWLMKNNYPLGFQTLCMNCQWIKRDERREYSAGYAGGK